MRCLDWPTWIYLNLFIFYNDIIFVYIKKIISDIVLIREFINTIYSIHNLFGVKQTRYIYN
jgi:hypothetical protein